MDVQTVGWIGLGIMGKPMARNALRAGFRVIAHNRSHPALDELVSDGALAARSAREVAERSDVVVTDAPRHAGRSNASFSVRTASSKGCAPARFTST